MTVKTELEQALIDLFKADSAFDGVAAFARGVVYLSPMEWFPLCEVVIGSREERGEETGMHLFVYQGDITFSIQTPDNLAVNGATRTIEVPSHDAVAELADAAILLLNAPPANLGGFVSADGKERVRQVLAHSPQYTIAPSRSRANNLENLTIVKVVIQTQRQKT